MSLKHLTSHAQMLSLLRKDTKNYVLLYKSGSESSECSLRNITEAAGKLNGVSLMVADVNIVRDIHTAYGVTSAPALLVFEGERFINVVKGCNEPAHYINLFEEAYFHPLSLVGQPRQKSVTVYTTPDCSWCKTLKSYLKSNNIHYTEVDVSRNQQAAEQMVRRSGQHGVPQTDIDGTIVVGFDRNRINSLLGITSQKS
ncbi:MAG TPA: glutaredoxin domain-containing protein [Bacteroidales bacterium]|nr:glutaredoxin domain-containing protein [Bacteroidales bacterium]